MDQHQYRVFQQQVNEQQNKYILSFNTSHVIPIGIDLLDRLLSFDHRQRPTAVEALGKLVR